MVVSQSQTRLRQKAEKDKSRKNLATAQGKVEGSAQDPSGNTIRTPEQQKDFSEKAKEFQGEQRTPERDLEFQQAQDPVGFQAKEDRPIPTAQNIPSGVNAVTSPAEVLTGKAKELDSFQLLRKGASGQLSDEEGLALGLTELDLQTFRQGEADVSAFSQFVESIPVIGRLRTPRIGGISFGVADFLGSSPSQKVDVLQKDISKLTSEASVKVTLSQINPLAAEQYKSQVRQIEQEILKMESRIKLLSIQSPAIQGDPDKVKRIMAEIQNSKDVLDVVKLQMGI